MLEELHASRIQDTRDQYFLPCKRAAGGLSRLWLGVALCMSTGKRILCYGCEALLQPCWRTDPHGSGGINMFSWILIYQVEATNGTCM